MTAGSGVTHAVPCLFRSSGSWERAWEAVWEWPWKRIGPAKPGRPVARGSAGDQSTADLVNAASAAPHTIDIAARQTKVGHHAIVEAVHPFKVMPDAPPARRPVRKLGHGFA